MERDLERFLDYIHKFEGKTYVNDEYKVYVEDVLGKFRDKLPTPNTE